jgi:hypothetical protein
LLVRGLSTPGRTDVKNNTVWTLAVLTTSILVVRGQGAEPKPITPDQFVKLRSQIKPDPGGFEDIPWMTNLWEARRKAAAEGKPMYVWSGGGPPCGFT